jgi:Cft2 family RNA processing exonuclease
MRLLRSDEYWDLQRRRMIAETEQYLDSALRSGRRGVVIPSFPVGRGRVAPAIAAAFWRRILFESDEAR